MVGHGWRRDLGNGYDAILRTLSRSGLQYLWRAYVRQEAREAQSHILATGTLPLNTYAIRMRQVIGSSILFGAISGIAHANFYVAGGVIGTQPFAGLPSVNTCADAYTLFSVFDVTNPPGSGEGRNVITCQKAMQLSRLQTDRMS